jgi:twitching motility protein PilI
MSVAAMTYTNTQPARTLIKIVPVLKKESGRKVKKNLAFTFFHSFYLIMVKDYFRIQLRQSVQLAVPLESVSEVMTLAVSDICPVPGVTSALLGVVNQRGQLLWVLELADLLTDLLGLMPSSIQYRKRDRLTLLVINPNPAGAKAEHASPRLACVVSTLKGIVSLNSEKLDPIPASFSPAFSSFLTGLIQIEGLPVAVLNVSAIFAALRIVEN